jgi:uridine kinase
VTPFRQYALVMEAAELVAERIRACRPEAKSTVVVVALDGYSAAGKSTVAAAVAGHLDAAIVHVDYFYRDMAEEGRLRLSPVEGVDRYFDWERLRAEALLPLMDRRRAQFRCFDWATGAGLSGEVTVEPRDIVIVEGVYSARPEFDDLLRLKILVESPEDERQRRRRQRHDPNSWERRWDSAERHYFENLRPRSAFDLVVAGDEQVPIPSTVSPKK